MLQKEVGRPHPGFSTPFATAWCGWTLSRPLRHSRRLILLVRALLLEPGLCQEPGASFLSPSVLPCISGSDLPELHQLLSSSRCIQPKRDGLQPKSGQQNIRRGYIQPARAVMVRVTRERRWWSHAAMRRSHRQLRSTWRSGLGRVGASANGCRPEPKHGRKSSVCSVLLLLVVRPGAPSSVFVPSRDALCS